MPMKNLSEKPNSVNFKTPGTNQAILPVKKQELVAYLYDVMETPPGQPLKLTRRNFVGRFITSMRKYSNVPVKTEIPECWSYVVVEIPVSDVSNPDLHFNYFPLEHVEQINDYLQASFDLFFHVYFFDLGSMRKIDCVAEEEIEFTKLHLVDSFISGLNLIDLDGANEMMKKREYRRELEYLNRKRLTFIKKERRFRIEIYEKRKKYIQSVVNQ
jgi:hypothetical protein